MGELCWICGSVADTREHMAKASDIENGFGDVTQDEPIYLNILSGFNRKNKIIKNLKAESLKYQKSLCEKCNTNISRPYDMAWADFVKWSLGRNPPLRVGDVICAQQIFPNDAETSMLRVYLYLLKAFGCMANVAFDGAGWDLDLRDIGKSFLDGTSHPRIFVRFGVFPSGKDWIGATDPWVSANRTYRQLDVVWWIYSVKGVGAAVFYVRDNPEFVRKERLWHPSFGTNHLVVADFT